ncbi:hypothetical protein KR52_09005 [Synechococcus sp. KORDI-52]|nr:hypothetical protein KR52_09005 [Synechococcus sp. KORDI-52]
MLEITLAFNLEIICLAIGSRYQINTLFRWLRFSGVEPL